VAKRRNEHGRLARRGELPDRTAGPGKHKVARAERGAELLGEGEEAVVRPRHSRSAARRSRARPPGAAPAGTGLTERSMAARSRHGRRASRRTRAARVLAKEAESLRPSPCGHGLRARRNRPPGDPVLSTHHRRRSETRGRCAFANAPRACWRTQCRSASISAVGIFRRAAAYTIGPADVAAASEHTSGRRASRNARAGARGTSRQQQRACELKRGPARQAGDPKVSSS